MIIRQPNKADWERFSSLTGDESWRVPRSELQRFYGPWSQYAYVLEDNGFCGLATAVPYENSAWIGNLIVPLNLRGKGYGSHLFRSVFNALVAQGITSIWLTASEQGRAIYQKEGFEAADRIERWVLPPQQKLCDQAEPAHSSCEQLLSMDSLVWGESRTFLLSELCNAGKIFSAGGAVALLQHGKDCQIIGPWYSHEATICANHDLLQKMIVASDSSVAVVIDCLASSQIQPLCNALGFQYSGQTTLMVRGDIEGVNLKNMVSLASLGSIG
ncbi:MAG: GNAT family N-acetyltransferase [Desulfuromonadales bacterium]|nr:GNAT family N-acetyltransferase [Desulfuromonadales bacterium]